MPHYLISSFNKAFKKIWLKKGQKCFSLKEEEEEKTIIKHYVNFKLLMDLVSLTVLNKAIFHESGFPHLG